MRTGVVAGTSLILLEGVGWMTGRFGTVWWAVELLQVSTITCAILLITRRMAKLEALVNSQRTRLEGIASFIREGLRMNHSEDDNRPKRVLRSVS